MAKAAILFSVLVLGWTWTLHSVHTQSDAPSIEQRLINTAPDVNATQLNQTEICELKPVMGLCRAYVEHYFYNSTSKSCEMFVYGGCGGNQNNFEKEADCVKACVMEATEAPTAASN